MPLTKDLFIKSSLPYDMAYSTHAPAPMFRRRFTLNAFQKATVSLCTLGYGYLWVNGRRASGDLFAAPVSNYEKTLWYYDYDVTELLHEGENVVAVMCGNGFFNEAHKSSWNFEQASWRDQPKLAFSLNVDGETALVSDESWLCSLNSPVTYNYLRSGEYFDARLLDDQWNTLACDESGWANAVRDANQPGGVLRLCPCEPVKEFEEYPAKSVVQTGDKKYLFDLGQNMSGYIRLRIAQQAGDELVIRYGEQINPDNSLNMNDMERHYPESAFQTDRFICDGRAHVWSPLFAYHGFRYIEIDGLTSADCAMVSGVFVHQAVEIASSFESSDATLNKLFRLGQMATLSNLFYMPTDCPTREKLGWANDAQASAEQMLTDFTAENLFRKWIVDVRDAMLEDGSMPGIIPTAGWGYHWGNGPVSDGVMFEIPYRVYLHTGDTTLLTDSLPTYRRYLAYLKTKEDDGEVNFGLDDWARPNQNAEPASTPLKLINSALRIKFLRITALAAGFAGEADEAAALQAETDERVADYKARWLNADGTCAADSQSAVAITVYHNLYDDLSPLAAQLKRLVEEKDFHHHCGMVGLRHLYIALNRCGLHEYAYRIIVSKGRPGYGEWLDGDATTLWEKWNDLESKNHHMYSDFMSWLIKTPGGIDHADNAAGFTRVKIAPRYLEALDWCRVAKKTVRGEVALSWKRTDGGVEMTFRVPEGMVAEYEGAEYGAGEHCFTL